MVVDVENGGHPLQPRWGKGSLYERFESVRPYLEGRSVLDLGCASGHRRSDWMHGLITGVARDVVGVDLDADAVDQARHAGHSILVGDAQSLRLDRTFDVVFAGELIEHLDDFRGFFRTVRAHLASDGVLILTTPNAFRITNVVYRFGGKARVNPDHMCWFCEDTLRQLLQRNGFELLELRYLPHRTPGRVRRAAAGMVRMLLPDRLAWNTMLAVARPRPGAGNDAATSTDGEMESR